MATSSSGSNVNEDFQQLMQKLAGIEPLEAREELRVEKMAAASINRIHREPLKKVPHNYNFNENTERIGDMYKDGVTGLTKLGWMEFPHSLGSGRYGSVTLGMRLDQGHLNPEERQLCGIKGESECENMINVV